MNRILKVLSLALVLTLALTFTAFADEEQKAAAYLAEYYGIEFGETVTIEELNARGIKPTVYRSVSSVGGPEQLQEAYKRYDELGY